MTLDKEDKPLIITDGALNVLPNVKTKMHILKNVIGFSKRIGNNRPKVAVLSATEEVLKREYQLLGKTRLSHIWHMTLDKEDKPLIITDGALNVLPNVKTKMHILKNVIGFSKRIGNNKPKVAVLSATEEVLDSIQSSMEAKEITELSNKENLDADVFGPLAFDNCISKKSANIKGIKNIVAGEADVLLVPSVETGNALVKMMIYFMAVSYTHLTLPTS